MQLSFLCVEIAMSFNELRLEYALDGSSNYIAWRDTIKEETSSSDAKIDFLAKTLERVDDILVILRENHNAITNLKSEIPTSEKTITLENLRKLL